MSFFSRLFSNKTANKRRKVNKARSTNYNQLEKRELMAADLVGGPSVVDIQSHHEQTQVVRVDGQSTVSVEQNGETIDVNVNVDGLSNETQVVDPGNLNNVIEAIDFDQVELNEAGQGVPSLELDRIQTENIDTFLTENNVEVPVRGQVVEAFSSLYPGPNQNSVILYTVDTTGNGDADRAFVHTASGGSEDFLAAYAADGAQGVLEGVPLEQIGSVESINFEGSSSVFFQQKENGMVVFWATGSVNGKKGSVDFNLSPRVTETRSPEVNLNVALSVQRTVNNTSIAPAVTGTTLPVNNVGQKPTLNLRRPPIALSGAQNVAFTDFGSFPLANFDQQPQCGCEGAAETSDEVIRATDEAFKDEDLISPTPSFEEKEKEFSTESRDLLFEGSEELEDWKDHSLNLKKSNLSQPIKHKTSQPNAETGVLFGVIAGSGVVMTTAKTLTSKDE